jgi:hypothetical protein
MEFDDFLQPPSPVGGMAGVAHQKIKTNAKSSRTLVESKAANAKKDLAAKVGGKGKSSKAANAKAKDSKDMEVDEEKEDDDDEEEVDEEKGEKEEKAEDKEVEVRKRKKGRSNNSKSEIEAVESDKNLGNQTQKQKRLNKIKDEEEDEEEYVKTANIKESHSLFAGAEVDDLSFGNDFYTALKLKLKTKILHVCLNLAPKQPKVKGVQSGKSSKQAASGKANVNIAREDEIVASSSPILGEAKLNQIEKISIDPTDFSSDDVKKVLNCILKEMSRKVF